jgi:primosomal protein N'
MNEQEINQLFLNLPFREAKDRIIDDLKRNGCQLTGNESIWELKSLAVKTHSGNNGNIAKDYAKGGSANVIDDDTLNNANVVDEDVNDDVVEPQQVDEPTPSNEPDTNNDPEPTVPDNDKPDEPVGNSEPNNDDTNNHQKRRKRRTKEETTKDKLERIDSDKKKKEEQLKKLQDEMERLKEEEERIKEEERKRKEQEEEERKKQQQAQNNKKHKNEDEIVRRLKCLKKAFLVGPAGTGKSTLAMKACAEIFNIEGGVDGVVKSDKFAQISF